MTTIESLIIKLSKTYPNTDIFDIERTLLGKGYSEVSIREAIWRLVELKEITITEDWRITR